RPRVPPVLGGRVRPGRASGRRRIGATCDSPLPGSRPAHGPSQVAPVLEILHNMSQLNPPPGVRRVTTYDDFAGYLRDFADGVYPFLYVVGRPGLVKTEAVRRALRGRDVYYATGGLTPRRIKPGRCRNPATTDGFAGPAVHHTSEEARWTSP